jgi:hypothetical protein
MSRAPRAASPHDLLRQAPGGSFTARARGLLKLEFILLDPNGRKFGWLQLRGASNAELRLGDRVVTFETSGRGYRMVVDGKEVLVAAPKGWSGGELQVSCGGQSYEARADLLRNLAVASYREGGERALHLSGGLLGRDYEALLTPGDRCAFPITVFLLWYVAANRRRAYHKRNPARRAEMQKASRKKLRRGE